MATGAGEIDEQAVYACTGSPLPSDIEQCVQWLLNDDFVAAFQRVVGLQQHKGLALVDIVREITPCVPPRRSPPHRAHDTVRLWAGTRRGRR